MKNVYLDYAATTPVDREVMKAMKPYFSEKFGNPMSIHSFGQEAQVVLDKSRKEIADFLGCDSSEIIFTSGATESNNSVIKGVIRHHYLRSANMFKPHIVTTQIEHHCLLNACRTAEREGLAEITYLPVYKEGIVKLQDLKKAIKKNTILVSIMYVNNEIGTVQPIAEIGRMLKTYNIKHETKKASLIKNEKNCSMFHVPCSMILFHTDATQAVNYFNCDVSKLGVDMLSLSGHKIYGPKGVGTMYIRKGTPIMQIMDGGEQEFGRRAGTHNVPGIVGLAESIRQLKVKNTKLKVKEILNLRNYLIKRVLKEIPDSYLNGSKEKRSPNNINFRFNNVEGESLVLTLDQEGIAASTGSACSTGTLEPSHVLLALGLNPEQAHGSLRTTLGKYTTRREIDYTIKVLKQAVKRLRNISGDILKEFK
jgi:cysteine desulfurase